MRITRIKDDEIQELLREKKEVPIGLCPPQMTARNGHYRKSFEFKGANGTDFVIKVRQTIINPANFSVILGYRLPGSYAVFRLRRYNGKHDHENVLEGERFRDFHIHTATERYQKSGFDEDHFAQPSDRHFDLRSAIDCLIEDCGFTPMGRNYSLFGPKAR
jgi:hypothetical protein